LSVGLLGEAVSQELPIVQPSLPGIVVPPTIPVTFDAFRNVTASADGTGLHLDLGDPTLQGTFHFGIFPFAEGEADLAYTRFRNSGPVVNGQCDLPVSSYLSNADAMNANNWPDGNGLLPPTMTVTARLDLVRVDAGKTTQFGLVDGRFSFRMAGTAVQPSLTIVEGPLVNLKESGDPSRVTISWRTDGTATARVRVVAASGPHRRIAMTSLHPLLGAGPEFTAGTARHHKVPVTGLSPSTRYLYLVESEAPDGTVARSPLSSFTTAPRAGQGDVTFMATSDNSQDAGGGERSAMGVNRQTAGLLALAAVRHEADLVLFSGDLVQGFSGNAADYRFQFQGWKDVWSPFWNSRPVYCVPGNHEALANFYQDSGANNGVLMMDRWPYARDSAEAVFADEFVMPANGPVPADPSRPPYRGSVYSFQYGPVLFVGLNSVYWWTTDNRVSKYGGSPEGYLMDDQLRWFEGVMASAQRSPTVRFIVVFLHEPAFPSGPAAGQSGMSWDGNNAMRAYTRQGETVIPAGEGIIEVRNRFWRSLADNSKAAALVAGHQHAYSRLLVDERTPVGVLPGDDTNQDGVLDRFSPDPAFRLPVWQIVTSSGGAPHFANTIAGTPWTPAVVSNQEGYCIFRTRGDALSMTAYSISGQEIDSVDDLMAVKRHAR
jgi:3',5'-cyclic AMP phosphodiesterase CpdA